MNPKLYISSIYLKNFAMFEDVKTNFYSGFNAITGETGSGKSLILDALQLVLGGRADKKFLRKSADFYLVEITFYTKEGEIREFLKELGFPFEDTITIKRIVSLNGNSKSFLNHSSCSLNDLTVFARKYIDIVGQYENQKLLSSDYQLGLLDKYVSNSYLKEYQSKYAKFLNCRQELEQIQISNTNNKEREDYLNFRCNEIIALDPKLDEEDYLKDIKNRISKSSELKEKVDAAIAILQDQDDNILSLLKKLWQLTDAEVVKESYHNLQEYTIELQSKNFDDESMEMDRIMNRLDHYQRVKRKFNCTTEELLEKLERIKKELNSISNLERLIEEKTLETASLEKELINIAKRMHKLRSEGAKKLSYEAGALIRSFNMPGASIDVNVSASNLGPSGLDKVVFLAETNKNDGFYKIKEIASGGELSRILLAIRMIMAEADSVSVFFFDEIESGIGGKTALTIGQGLKQVSKTSQVLAITHLPQVAVFSDYILEVSKKMKGEKINSYISLVAGKQRNDYIKGMNPIESFAN